MNSPTGRRTDAAMMALSALGPSIVAALHTGNVASGAEDAAVVRVLGLGPTVWRGLDAWVGSLLALAPIGTRVTRAALGGALVAGAAGVVLYALARSFLAALAPTRRLGFVVSAIGSLTVTLSAPWQVESTAVGGEVLGAVLAVVPLALLAARRSPSASPSPEAIFALAIALGYAPAIGVCAAAGAGAWWIAYAASRPGAEGETASGGPTAGGTTMAAVLGAIPFVVAVMHALRTGAPLGPAFAASLAGGSATFGHAAAAAHRAGAGRGPLATLGEQAGGVLGLLAAAGAALGAVAPRPRPYVVSLAALMGVGLGVTAVVPEGAHGFPAPWLVSFGALVLLAAAAMHALARAVAAARVPLARASAAMVVVLEAVFPVEEIDDALTPSSVPADAASVWDEAAWAPLPPRSVVLLAGGDGLETRAAASRLQGGLRDDVMVLTACAGCPPPWPDLAAEPRLVPVWRDLVITGAPTEASLSALAAGRPLAMAFDPRWGLDVGRHLVPWTLFDRFEPEPRGSSDRRHALDALAPALDRLASVVAGDPALAAAAAALLDARAGLLAGGGDRALADRAASMAAAFRR